MGKTIVAGGQEPPVPEDRVALVQALEKQLSTLAGLIKKANRPPFTGDPAKSRALFGQLRQCIEGLAELTKPIRTMEQREAERADRQFLELESDLRAAGERRGWRIDGVWPTLHVDYGISLEVDDVNRSVTVAGRRVSSPSVEDIIAEAEPLVRGLIPKDFSPQAFMGRLAEAYDEVRGTSNQVPVFDVYRAFVIRAQSTRFWRDARAGAYVSISLDQFRARLSHALAENVTTTSDRRVLRMLPPINPKDGVFLYQPAEGRFGFVGRIEFVGLKGGEA
jgi:hypothetical protein